MMRNATGALAVAVAATLVGFRMAADTPLAIHIHSERAMFQVLVSPGMVGTDSFVLQLTLEDDFDVPAK
jgi:copper transport protein